MGELLLQIQKQSGGDHGNQYTGGKISSGVDFGKGKMQTVADMGMSQRQAEQYQQMAQNPEAVQMAIQKAIPNNNPYHENRDVSNLVKTKSEITSEMGMTKDQVSQYQQMEEAVVVNIPERFRSHYTEPGDA